MRSLFLKIFLSYWLAFALFLVTTILVTLALRPPRESSGAESAQQKFLTEAVQAYKTGGTGAVNTYLRNLRETQRVHAFLFDQQGHNLSGHGVPEWIERVERGQIHTADSIWGRMGPMQFLRPSITTADGQSYNLVIELPSERTRFGPHGIPGVGILIAILCSGLVCYLLTRYLTSPIVRLRAATQKLAGGDLTARAGGLARGHDEMSELVRDFDTMAERLENLVNAQGRLLKDISHELRSPLARLNVALELARQRAGTEAQSALERIDLEANRLNELIGRLLTIVRLESGGDTMRKALVHLGALVREITQDAAFEAQSRHCRVDCSIVNDFVVIGDQALLNSAIENIVRNAVRYTQEDTAVEVRLERVAGPDGPLGIVRVTDSGPGVPDEALEKLFRPFYRIDDDRGRGTGGAGLGLAIADRAVKLHGGTVKAGNRPEGGLMIEITLPLAPASVDHVAPTHSVAEA
jgi:two-component system sensor histidine kinase CpxA